jgi:hypothetical protein
MHLIFNWLKTKVLKITPQFFKCRKNNVVKQNQKTSGSAKNMQIKIRVARSIFEKSSKKFFKKVAKVSKTPEKGSKSLKIKEIFF